jgi:ActR/RegA family two-component response regulator
MSTLAELDFLLVSNDYATLTAVSGGVKKYGAKLAVVPTTETARDYLERRKIDGVFIDMQVNGGLALVDWIRRGPSNAKAAIFACVAGATESTMTLNAGANFLLRRPLTVEGVALNITIAKDVMVREQRRYFRYPVSIPVTLIMDGNEQQAKMTNLSEGGMAIRWAKPLKHKAGIDFAFELGLGATIEGKGLVAWTSTEGLAGIQFHTLLGGSRANLESWLMAREQLSATR